MYQKPRVQQFGSFRELTQIGLGANGDGGLVGFGRIVGDATDGQWWNYPNRS
jgi:hypothetical protein